MNYLSYLHTHSYGMVDDIINEFGEEGLRQMEAMGYIVNAPHKDGKTWRISQRAAQLVEARYRKSTWFERIIDWINIHIRKVDYSI